ncbi:hypothetical protein KCU71_g128, partial [Aureobasidium melanogenum]
MYQVSSDLPLSLSWIVQSDREALAKNVRAIEKLEANASCGGGVVRRKVSLISLQKEPPEARHAEACEIHDTSLFVAKAGDFGSGARSPDRACHLNKLSRLPASLMVILTA